MICAAALTIGIVWLVCTIAQCVLDFMNEAL